MAQTHCTLLSKYCNKVKELQMINLESGDQAREQLLVWLMQRVPADQLVTGVLDFEAHALKKGKDGKSGDTSRRNDH